MFLTLLAACSLTEPLDLPSDPAARGAPVGVRTIAARGQVFDIWYPAGDNASDQPSEPIDLADFAPQSVIDLLGPLDLVQVPTGAVRDADPRRLDGPLPVVLFSHGWGGFRMQSITLTEHLASRGYVVVSADHPGRHLADVLPCVFSPPLDGCDPALDDPAPEDLADVLAWLEEAAVDPGGFLEGLLDLDRLGLSGHSAGGGTTADLGDADTRFSALLPMAAPVTITRDVPALTIGGSCDPFADNAATAQARETGQLLQLQDAGHMAFSDLCRMDIVDLADRYLADRDDLNSAWYDPLLNLASNGCPGVTPPVLDACGDTFMDLDRSDTILTTASTLFFDKTLKGIGSAFLDGVFDDAFTVP